MLLWASPAAAQGWRCGGHSIEWAGGAPAAANHAEATDGADRVYGPVHEDGSQPTVPEPAGLNRQRWDDLVFNAYDLPRSRSPFIEPLGQRQTQVMEREVVPTFGICVQGPEHSRFGRRAEPYANEAWWRQQIERWSGIRWSGEFRVGACTGAVPDGWIYAREDELDRFGGPNVLAAAISRRERHPHGRGRWLASELIWNADMRDDVEEEFFESSIAHELGHALGFSHVPAATGYVMAVGITPTWPEEEGSLALLAYRVGPNVRYPGLLREAAGDGDPDHPDRQALTALHDGTNGREWTDSTNWGSAEPLDHWYGIATATDGRVNEIDLHENNLNGQISPELGDLAGLEHLILEGNPLTGPIPPALGELANLTRLDLSNTRLTGSIPPELGSLTNLRTLQISSPDLSGPLPPELGRLSSLEHLSFNFSGVSGPIPARLGDLQDLLTLTLVENALTGPIPPELGNLSRMWSLSLRGNELTGPVPSELARATRLRGLVLNGNDLSGPLPASLTELEELDTLHIHDNDGLCAPADAAFQEWLATVADFRGPMCVAAPVPALPLVGQLLLAVLFLAGGAQLYRRRLG